MTNGFFFSLKPKVLNNNIKFNIITSVFHNYSTWIWHTFFATFFGFATKKIMLIVNSWWFHFGNTDFIQSYTNIYFYILYSSLV